MSIKKWRCFHCDEVFTDAEEARDHFGYMEDGVGERTACQLTKDEKGLVCLLRDAWAELRRYHEEDTSLHRSLWSLSSDAESKRRDWGDKEYARGVAAGRGFPDGNYLVVPKDCTDDMKSAYGEAVYFTTDTRILPENIWRAMCDAGLKPPTADEVNAVSAAAE